MIDLYILEERAKEAAADESPTVLCLAADVIGLIRAVRAAERVVNNPSGFQLHHDQRMRELDTALAPFREKT